MASEDNPAQAAAAIVSDFVQAWVDEVQHFYDGVRSPEGLAATDVVDETKASLNRLMPIAQRGIALGLDLMRPWSTAFNQRDGDA